MRKVFLLLSLFGGVFISGCGSKVVEKAYTDISIVTKEETAVVTDGVEKNPDGNEEIGFSQEESSQFVQTEIKDNEKYEEDVIKVQDVKKDVVEVQDAKENVVEAVKKDDIETKTTEEKQAPEIKVIFSDVNETVYATGSVNVREGCDVSCNKVGALSTGDSLQRIGVGDNGWSKVIYNNSEAYISSKYLSTEKPKSQVEIDISDRGAYGKLTIPDVGINVALFYSRGDDYNSSQVHVDAEDSAAYIDAMCVGWTRNIIADHKHQGFNGIKKAVPYSTLAYINYGDYTKSYMCVGKLNGINTKNGLLDDTGESIKYGTEGHLIMYTCNENWQNITITYWEKV